MKYYVEAEMIDGNVIGGMVIADTKDEAMETVTQTLGYRGKVILLETWNDYILSTIDPETATRH